MGALEFEPAIDPGYDPALRFEIESLVEVARDALEKKSEFGVNLNDDNPTLKLPQFELDRIDYHFSIAKPGDRVKHDNSKYEPHTKKGKYGIYSFQKPDGSLRFHVGDVASAVPGSKQFPADFLVPVENCDKMFGILFFDLESLFQGEEVIGIEDGREGRPVDGAGFSHCVLAHVTRVRDLLGQHDNLVFHSLWF